MTKLQDLPRVYDASCETCRHWTRFGKAEAERYTAYTEPGRCHSSTDCGGGFMMTSIMNADDHCRAWKTKKIKTRRMKR